MSNIKTGDILNFDYTGAVQSVTLPKGTYKLECWGAQGGNRSQDSASATVTGSGLGGYSIGILTLTQLTTCYIYVGGQGGMSSSTGNVKVEGGFNGGGFASHESTGERYESSEESSGESSSSEYSSSESNDGSDE